MKVFSPKQVAQALGVSESSIKRWVDNGKLEAIKTIGGHRKVSLPSIVAFVRDSGMRLADASIVGMVDSVDGEADSQGSDLFDALVEGDESAARRVVLARYQEGYTVVSIGDRLVGPAFHQIGEGWQSGAVQVFQERGACEIAHRVLQELRGWIAPPDADAPLAMVATPAPDFAVVGVALVELTLLSLGWRVHVAGSSLPLPEIRDAALRLCPRLLCLSVSHCDDPQGFAQQFETQLVRPLRQSLTPPPTVVVGGNILGSSAEGSLECDLEARRLEDLVLRLPELVNVSP